MSIAELVRKMASAGAPPEAIAIAVEAVEAAMTDAEAMRAAGAARQARYRERHSNVTRNATVCDSDVMRNVTSNVVPSPLASPSSPPRDINSTPPSPSSTPPILVDVARSEAKKVNGEQLRFFGEQWNQLAGSLSLPQIDEIRPASTRERHALARMREMAAVEGGVAALLAKVKSSPYLRGEINGFRCTFDWIVNASNFQKIMEGNYDQDREDPRRKAIYAHR